MSATLNLATVAEPSRRLPDGLARDIDRRDRIPLTGQPSRVVAGPAAQLQNGADTRLPQRDQERRGPHPGPVQVIAALLPLAEEPIPELGTRIGHMTHAMPDPSSDRSLFAAGIAGQLVTRGGTADCGCG